MAGGVAIGGGAPITVQSMLNVPSTDIQGSVEQALRLERAGCQILRAAIPNKEAVALDPRHQGEGVHPPGGGHPL